MFLKVREHFGFLPRAQANTFYAFENDTAKIQKFLKIDKIKSNIMENQPMTQVQRDMQLTALNHEYTKKRHEIARKKDDEKKGRISDIQYYNEQFRHQRKELLNLLIELRRKKSTIADDTRDFVTLTENIRKVEYQLSILKEERFSRIEEINISSFFKQCDFEEERRKLTEWYEYEKLIIYREYYKQHEQKKLAKKKN